MSFTIVMTGGGTAGHVIPNIALIEQLKQEAWQLHYIGAKDGVEERMVLAQQVPFYAIRCGKLRRYFSWKTFWEPLNILAGIMQAYRIIRRIKPNIVFSKGGFVSFPVVVAAWLNNVPIVIHESDMTPGLANRMSFPFARKICVTFATTNTQHNRPVVITGSPVRANIFTGDRHKALQYCQFSGKKPCLLIIGGSMGAQNINRCVHSAVEILCQTFHVIHVCGKGKMDSATAHADYRQFEYIDEEMADVLALSDMVVARAGANTVFELLCLAKPHVFIPLSRKVSRGDQIQNAKFFEQQGISVVLDDDKLSKETLLAAIADVHHRQAEIIAHIKQLNILPANQKIIDILTHEATQRFW